MQQEESGASHQTMVISRSDIALEQTYPASVEGRQSIRMSPRVDGYLAEIRIHERRKGVVFANLIISLGPMANLG